MGNVLGLKELIEQVREDLAEAEKGVKGKGKLYVKEVVFEINMVAVKSVGGKGGIDLKVLTLGGDLSEENRHVHKVTIKAESSGEIPGLDEPYTLVR
jgi:hypothetical protein